MSTYIPSRRELLAMLAVQSLRAVAAASGDGLHSLVSRSQIWNVHSLGPIFGWPAWRRPGHHAVFQRVSHYRGKISRSPSAVSIRRSSIPLLVVDLAKAAHQKYMVFTTKHHDGFCMFDSQYTRLQDHDTPYKKDIVGQLANACRSAACHLAFTIHRLT